jgi:hypothetical protein
LKLFLSCIGPPVHQHQVIASHYRGFRWAGRLNGKIFIGSSTDLKAAWFAQKLKLDVGMQPNSDLQNDWNKFGPSNFNYEIIDEIDQKDEKPADIEKELKKC